MVNSLTPGKRQKDVGADGQLYHYGNGQNHCQRGISKSEEDNSPKKKYIHWYLRVEKTEKNLSEEAFAAIDYEKTGQVVISYKLLKKRFEAHRQGKSHLGVLCKQFLQLCLSFNQITGKGKGAQDDGAGEENGVANEAHQHVKRARHFGTDPEDAYKGVAGPVGIS